MASQPVLFPKGKRTGFIIFLSLQSKVQTRKNPKCFFLSKVGQRASPYFIFYPKVEVAQHPKHVQRQKPKWVKIIRTKHISSRLRTKAQRLPLFYFVMIPNQENRICVMRRGNTVSKGSIQLIKYRIISKQSASCFANDNFSFVDIKVLLRGAQSSI